MVLLLALKNTTNYLVHAHASMRTRVPTPQPETPVSKNTYLLQLRPAKVDVLHPCGPTPAVGLPLFHCTLKVGGDNGHKHLSAEERREACVNMKEPVNVGLDGSMPQKIVTQCVQ
eukprot:scaffold1456_cov15-Tisochrysis_lutea.AAC.2